MKALGYSLAGIGIFLLCWHIAAVLYGQSLVLPTPAETLVVLHRLITNITTFQAAFETAWKVFLSLFLVITVGIPLGLLLGLVDKLYEMFRPIIMVLQAVPVISWLALVIFIWGIGWEGPLLIAFLSLLPMAVLTTISGVRNLDKNLLEMAKVYRVPFKNIFRDIYLGSLVPFIVAIIDVSIGQAWKVILVAEYLCGDKGLGVQIAWARQFVDIPQVYALTLIAVIMGLITERLIKFWMGRFSKRWAPS